MLDFEAQLYRAAELLTTADSLLILAGAGMGVDSGLPDYRGDAGWWTHHAAFKAAGLTYEEVSTARAFFHNPELAWGVYGHKLELYRNTTPHRGYDILMHWAEQLPLPSFVVTSNIDGHFQKAGFKSSQVCEVHGSVHWLQCSKGCTQTTWSARNILPDVDPATLRWRGEIPKCIYCEAAARPNILMFNDFNWAPLRTAQQEAVFNQWRKSVRSPVVLELGAGLAIPRIRNLSAMYLSSLIRINPVDWQAPPQSVGLQATALLALRRLSELVAGD